VGKHDIRDVALEDPLWGLLEHYVRLLNRRLKKKGLPRVVKGQVIGAILTRFLLVHRAEIMEENAAVELEKHLGISTRAARRYGLELPEASELTGATQASDGGAALRSGGNSSGGPEE
jgi:hypothetical protein